MRTTSLVIHSRTILAAWGLCTVLNTPALAQRGENDTGYWDVFCVNLNKAEGQYWEQVSGGAGPDDDPLGAPEPDAAPVIWPAASLLGGITWAFSGHKWADGVLDSFATPAGAPKEIELKEGPGEYHLSFTLDTATSPQSDMLFPSWGRFEHIVVQPFVLIGGVNMLAPPIAPAWIISPFDPDGGTIVVPGLVSTITVASFDFFSVEPAVQLEGIWGAAVRLPAVIQTPAGLLEVHGWHVEFELLPTLGGGMHTWDTYRAGFFCYPDCNLSGTLTVADFICFQTKFVAGDPYADCNNSGTLTVADFVCFQTSFVAGCDH